MMKKGNLLIALGLEGIGIWVIIDSYKLGLRSIYNPGAGLFPFLLGILLCLFALPAGIRSLKDKEKIDMGAEEEVGCPPHFKKVGILTASLIGYFVFLEILGFLITSFLFIGGLFLLGRPRRWRFSLLFSAGTVLIAYLIFHTLLKIPLPSGPLG